MLHRVVKIGFRRGIETEAVPLGNACGCHLTQQVLPSLLPLGLSGGFEPALHLRNGIRADILITYLEVGVRGIALPHWRAYPRRNAMTAFESGSVAWKPH